MSLLAEGLPVPVPAPAGLPRVGARALPGADADLAVDGLTKTFQPGDCCVLDGVSFEVREGTAVALLGPNGCGKSTLLRCCLRLIEPDGGHVRFLGTDVRALGSRALRRFRARIGFVFQRHNLVPRASVLTNVVHGALGLSEGGFRCMSQGLAPAAIREQAMACLARVGLVHLAARRADQLSGGESQRVAIARVLMAEPEFVIADEPTASLDPAVGQEVMDLFAALTRESGITVLFTSHDLSQALRYADRIIGLRAGRIELDEEASRAARPRLERLYV